MANEFSPEVLNLLQTYNKETVKIEPVNSGLVKNQIKKMQIGGILHKIWLYLHLKVLLMR